MVQRRSVLRTIVGAAGPLIAGCSADRTEGGTTRDDPDAASDGEGAAAGTDDGTPSDDGESPESDPGSGATATRTESVVRPDTPDETPVHVIDAPADGPTVAVVGGFHGDETAGWRAAERVVDWEIAAGRLVVIPRAARRAIEADARDHPEYGDANRLFPIGESPRTPLGRALWEAIADREPAYLLDLHTARDIYGESDSFGQAVFHSPSMRSEAAAAVEHLNDRHVPEDAPEYEYIHEETDDDWDMLFRKAAADLGTATALHEVTEKGLALETQVEWSLAFVGGVLSEVGVRDLGAEG